jgi:hypothetical protein
MMPELLSDLEARISYPRRLLLINPLITSYLKMGHPCSSPPIVDVENLPAL